MRSTRPRPLDERKPPKRRPSANSAGRLGGENPLAGPIPDAPAAKAVESEAQKPAVDSAFGTAAKDGRAAIVPDADAVPTVSTGDLLAAHTQKLLAVGNSRNRGGAASVSVPHSAARRLHRLSDASQFTSGGKTKSPVSAARSTMGRIGAIWRGSLCICRRSGPFG